MTKISKNALAVSVAIGVLWTGTAIAKQGSPEFMSVSGKTSQPIGHYEYCKIYRSDCSISSFDTKPTKLSKARWAEMVRINSSVNQRVTPVTDLDLYNVEERWAYPERFGDCEDYVLEKRRLLMQSGWAASSLLITVVLQPNGEGHAVLTVRTSQGDFILDNLNGEILPWTATGYRFLKRQAASYSGGWETIDDSRTQFVGSVRK
ncbi:MAG: transglutaminase-like cysteine peptidase [Nitratireductor sp.]